MNVGGYRLQEPDFLEEDKSGAMGCTQRADCYAR